MLRIATLGYHDITDDLSLSGFQRPLARAYKHTTAAFAAHLDAIATAAPPPDLVTDIDFTAVHRQHLLLTFDDGGRSAMYVGDALCRRGWRGHFMITTGLIGGRTFLTKADIADLRRCGHIVGSHSHTHPDIFRRLSRREMQHEWQVSCDVLAQLLGEACACASVPGGDSSPEALRAATACGVKYLFTSEPTLTPKERDGCRVLGRLCVKRHLSPAQVSGYAAGVGWRRALLMRRCSLAARRLLTPLYVFYVRRQTNGHAAWPVDGRGGQHDTTG